MNKSDINILSQLRHSPGLNSAMSVKPGLNLTSLNSNSQFGVQIVNSDNIMYGREKKCLEQLKKKTIKTIKNKVITKLFKCEKAWWVYQTDTNNKCNILCTSNPQKNYYNADT